VPGNLCRLNLRGGGVCSRTIWKLFTEWIIMFMLQFRNRTDSTITDSWLHFVEYGAVYNNNCGCDPATRRQVQSHVSHTKDCVQPYCTQPGSKPNTKHRRNSLLFQPNIREALPICCVQKPWSQCNTGYKKKSINQKIQVHGWSSEVPDWN
jgi:hypothetical protein